MGAAKEKKFNNNKNTWTELTFSSVAQVQAFRLKR